MLRRRAGFIVLWGILLVFILSMTSFAEETVKYHVRDEFDSFDSSFWTVTDKNGDAMDKVDVSNGILTLSNTETDVPPTLISKGIPIEMGDKLIITRKTYAHTDNTYFAPAMYITEETDTSWNSNADRDYHILLFFQHLNFTYDQGRYPGGLTKGNFAYARLDSFTRPNELSSENYGVTRSTLDEWVEEEFIYDTVTGDVTITSGGETMAFKSRPLEYSHVRFHMNPYGWYTGQYDKMDYVDFKIVGQGFDDQIEDNSNADMYGDVNYDQVYYNRFDFNGSSLDSNFWYVYDKSGEAYDRVTVSGGEMTLPNNETDNPPILTSKGIPVQPGDIFKIKRRTFAHAENDTYRPWTVISEEVNDSFNVSADRGAHNLISYQHLYFTYDPGRYPEGVTEANLGMYLKPGQQPALVPRENYGISPLTIDQWVEEEIVYNTATGDVSITSNGNTMYFKSKPLELNYLRYHMNPYGWFTGQYDKLDWIEFIVERPAGSGTSTGGSSTGNIVNPTGSSAIEGTVFDLSSEGALSGVNVTLYKAGQAVANGTTDSQGKYSFSVEPGMYDITISKSGYVNVDYKAIETLAMETTYLETVFQAQQSNTQGTTTGTIYNAVTGAIEPDAVLEIRAGMNNTTGQMITKIEAGEDGSFSYSGAPGNYTFTAIKDGFVKKSFTVPVLGGEELEVPDVAISPLLNANQFRVVLRWGVIPNDVDAHITGPKDDSSERAHVYFGDQQYIGDTTQIILDVDDQNGEGPETITVTNIKNGVYTFSVHDYSNKNETDSTALADSQAIVEVYIGNNPAKVFNVPNASGTLWTVFAYDGRQIKPINTMSYQSDSEAIK